jgi:ADP-heptose:LPS heptosyltransferase
VPVGGDVLAVGAGRAGPAGRGRVLLVLRALGLGDLLTAAPALRALARAFPDRRRVLAAPARLAPLAGAIDPALELVDVPAWTGRDGAPRARLARRLPAGAVAVDLHGRGPQSHRLLLATRPERLIAFAHRDVPQSAGGPAWTEDEHEVARWCRLLSEEGIPADPRALDLPHPGGAGRDEALTLLHPGAASAARRWPAERWAVVARAARAAGRDVILTGSAAEAGLARAVADAAGLPPRAVAAGRTDLRELIALVARAGRVACGDTGVAHLATALGTPSVVLFGPTSPARWGPPPERPWHRVLWTGRTGDPHASAPDAGLLAIAPDAVLAALSGLPEPSPRRARPHR